MVKTKNEDEIRAMLKNIEAQLQQSVASANNVPFQQGAIAGLKWVLGEEAKQEEATKNEAKAEAPAPAKP
jgi:hypothetical protein